MSTNIDSPRRQPTVPRSPFAGSHTLNVHAQRLKSEADATLLRNRLERLKLEEAKALKKIAETRKRADEIMELKKRNDARSREKHGQQVEQQRRLEEARQRVHLQKVSRAGATDGGKQKVQQSKLDLANQTRQEREHIRNKVAAQSERDSRRARQIYSTIKEHQNQVSYTRMQERMMQEDRLQAETQRKMLFEETKRREAEQLVHDMEASEEVLIERLRRTQEAQKLAYEELELALSVLSPRESALRDMRESIEQHDGGRLRGPPEDRGAMRGRLIAMAPPQSRSMPITPRSPRTDRLAPYGAAGPPPRSASGLRASPSPR